MFVDSHVNLHSEKFADDLPDVLARAKEASVLAMLTICCRISEFSAVLDIAQSNDAMWASVGTHPHEARENPDIKPNEIIALSHHAKVIGIGETGLDFHYNYSEKPDQVKNFVTHIEAARQTQLPLIIHTREADDLMADILQSEMKNGAFPALLHCYTSGPQLARIAADLGFYFSVSGILTFKNAHDVRAITRHMPDDRIMIETDCPYLAPVPYRGRRNEPAYVPHVAAELGRIKGWDIEETAQRTTDAFFTLFKKADRPASLRQRVGAGHAA